MQVSTELGKLRGVGTARDIRNQKQKHIENYPKRVDIKILYKWKLFMLKELRGELAGKNIRNP